MMGAFDPLAPAQAESPVRLWSEMNARDRAELWPYLDPVTRSVHWRDMTKREREEMRSHLSAAENEKIRRRYCFTEETTGGHAPRARSPLAGLRDKDRNLMRQQIMEVHIELGGGRAHRLRPAAGSEFPVQARLP